MPEQNTVRQISPEIPLSSFHVNHLLLGVGPSLNVISIPIETPMKKINFSFTSGCQLEIDSGLRMGACVSILSQC